MSLKQYLFSRVFVMHALLAASTSFLIFYGFYRAADIYTMHGETVKVPDLNGRAASELTQGNAAGKFVFTVVDSIYDPNVKGGLIIRQDPEKGSLVKEGRIIYLFIASHQPPKLLMPKLVDKSLRQAIAMIESYGLKSGNVKMVADPCKNCILSQQFQGKDILPGSPVRLGSKIDLVVGKGSVNETVALPDCIGLTFEDAKNKLSSSALQVGLIVPDAAISDTMTSFVYKQRPGSGNEVQPGTKVDLYITNDESKLDVSKAP